MLLVKSFFRKKTTKIYFIIFVLIFTFLLILMKYKKEYIQLANENFSGSYIEISFSNLEERMKHIHNIKDIQKGFSMISEFETYYYFSKDGLSEHGVSVNKNLFSEVQLGQQIELNINGKQYIFVVEHLFDHHHFYNTIFVNRNILEMILKDNEDLNTIYRIDLNNWIKRDRTIKKLKKSFHLSDLTMYLTKKQDINFDSIVFVCDVLFIFLVIIFTIIFFISLLNILSEEKKMNFIYYCIGYRNINLLCINFFKLFLLILFSFLFSFFLFQCFEIILMIIKM